MATPAKIDTNQKLDTPETMSPNSTSSSPEAISEEFLEFEGSTIFAPPPSPTYRYSISLQSGKLRIWLENCESKNQWCTAKLSLEDFVDATNAIPNASAANYVEYFHELLNGARDDPQHVPIAFQRHKGEVFRLEVTVKIQVLRHSHVTKYTLDMEPISLSRVDVLEAKVRDLEEKVTKLRVANENARGNQSIDMEDLEAMLKGVQDRLEKRGTEISVLEREVKALRFAQDTTENVQLQATTKVADWICWNNYADGLVKVTLPGLYQLTVVANYESKNTSSSIQLMKGSECIQTAFCGYAQGYCNSTAMTCITRVEKNHHFAVKCPVRLTGTSYLTLVRLGK